MPNKEECPYRGTISCPKPTLKDCPCAPVKDLRCAIDHLGMVLYYAPGGGGFCSGGYVPPDARQSIGPAEDWHKNMDKTMPRFDD